MKDRVSISRFWKKIHHTMSLTLCSQDVQHKIKEAFRNIPDEFMTSENAGKARVGCNGIMGLWNSYLLIDVSFLAELFLLLFFLKMFYKVLIVKGNFFPSFVVYSSVLANVVNNLHIQWNPATTPPATMRVSLLRQHSESTIFFLLYLC